MSRTKSILYSLLGQLFLVLSIPVITRLYSPETVGAYGELLAVATIIGINSALKLDVSLVSTPTKLKSKHILSASLIITTVVCFLASIIYGSLKLNSIYSISLLFFLSFSISVNQLMIYFETARSNIQFISRARLKRGFFAASFQSCGGAISSSLSTLVLSLAFSNFLSLQNRIGYVFRMYCIGFKNRFLINKVVKDKFDFCKFSLPQGLLNSISTNMPIIYFGLVGEYHLLGLYVVAERFIRSPVNFINVAIRQIFIADYRKSDSKINCYFMWLIPLIMICVILSFLIYNYSGDVINVILGNEWSQVTDIILILLPWLILSVIQVPASGTFIVNNKIKLYAKIEVIDFVFKLLALFIGFLNNDVRLSLCLFVIVGCSTYIVTVTSSLFMNLSNRIK